SVTVNDISRVAFSPDGQRFATATYNYATNDGTVKLWDAKTGQELLTRKDGGRTVAFSFDGKRLVSGRKVWDAATGQELLSLKGFEKSVVFSPDGKRLDCAGAGHAREKGVKLRDAQTGEESTIGFLDGPGVVYIS